MGKGGGGNSEPEDGGINHIWCSNTALLKRRLSDPWIICELFSDEEAAWLRVAAVHDTDTDTPKQIMCAQMAHFADVEN